MLINKQKIIIFVMIIVIFGITLYILPQFVNTKYYLNKELAYSAVQGLSYEEGIKVSAKYINPFYCIYNFLCHICTFLVAIFVVFISFKTLKMLQNKKHLNIYKKFSIFIWINFSYYIWAIITIDLLMNDLNKEVLDSCHDSLGIPLLGMGVMFIFIALIYYPAINFLTYSSYIKKIKNRFFNIIFILMSLVMLICVLIDIYSNFVIDYLPKSIIINIIDIIWFILGFNCIKIHINQCIGRN